MKPSQDYNKSLSVAAPCYNEGPAISDFLEKTFRALENLPQTYACSVLIVDDGSRPETRSILREESKKRKNLRVIYLRRNYGHQSALMAAIDHSNADINIFLDSDLQDDPALIGAMVEMAEKESCDTVVIKRKSRAEGIAFKICSQLFYFIFRKLSRLDDFQSHGTYSLVNRTSLDCLKKLKESSRYYPGLLYYIGGKRGTIFADRGARASGKSKVGWSGLFRLAFNAFFSFSNAPLQIFSYLGFSMSCLTFLGAVISAILRITTDHALYGWTSLFSAILFLGGLQLLGIGMLGEYLARTFIETKKRPQYLVGEDTL